MTTIPLETVEIVRDDEGNVTGIAGPGLTRCVYWPRSCAEVQAQTPTCFPSCGYCTGDFDEGERPERRV